jgi:hypothetical protein
MSSAAAQAECACAVRCNEGLGVPPHDAARDKSAVEGRDRAVLAEKEVSMAEKIVEDVVRFADLPAIVEP